MEKTKPISRILLIEDDRDDCFLFREALARVAPQTELRCMEDADQLWTEMETQKPCLVVIDFKLPKEDGIHWVRQLKAHPAYCHLPVVMWSTSSLKSIVAEAYSAGVQLYLEKPWDIGLLAAELKKILRRHHQALVSLTPLPC